jgi:DNA-binding NtrC family response regulator
MRRPARWHRARIESGPDGPAGVVAQQLSLTVEDRARLRILLVDGERSHGESCASVLQHQGYSVTVSRRSEEALEQLKRSSFDIVLVDLGLSPISGMDLLRAALAANRNAVVIVVTANPSVESSLEAVQAGAWDYLPKPFSATHLEIIVGRAAHAALAAREFYESPRLVSRQGTGDGAEPVVLGTSPAFRRVIELARRVAPTDASVFITGESGTGKEMVAQFIHYHSRRRNRPLVAVNCAALPEQLLESEMFGHCKGAFTGAVRDKPGLLETANGGTMFLDELIEMPKPLQAKLLRVIQDGVVRRVGSETTDAVVNVRFIAATNHDPEEALKAGMLREDLYYRLRVVPVPVPPLRNRSEDIPPLATHFLNHYWARHRDGRCASPRFSEAALRALRLHYWRGNVRELQNVIEHAVVLLEPGAQVQPGDLPLRGEHHVSEGEPHVSQPPQPFSTDAELEESYYTSRDRVLAEFERRYLLRLVDRAGGNMCQAARMGGIDRTTLYRLLKHSGIQRRSLPVIE